MKISLKKSLQIRFILLSFISLLILQSLILGLSLWHNYQHISIKADQMIMKIISNPNDYDVTDAKYFIVSFKTKAVTSHTSLMNNSKAFDYAKKVMNRKNDKGYIDEYRYLVHRTKDNIEIIFLYRAATLEYFYNSMNSLFITSMICIAIMMLLLIFLSGKIVSPLVNNRLRQKEFITSASHELKTPLTVIGADAQLLELEIGENEWLVDIQSQIKQMTKMTNHLVYLARAEEQEEKINRIIFPISDMGQEISDSYKALAIKDNKKYILNIEENFGYKGDEKSIREMMGAMIDNAFKYSNKLGTIKISLLRTNRGVCFITENTIDDNQEQDVSNFTKRFYKGTNSCGFGIGLSIAQATCKSHKGKLKIEMIKDNIMKISAFLN